MWKYKAIIRVDSWYCKNKTIQIFMKDIWAPLLNGVNSIQLESAGFDLDIKKITYHPKGKFFSLDLKSLEISDYSSQDVMEWFKDWTCEIDSSKSYNSVIEMMRTP